MVTKSEPDIPPPPPNLIVKDEVKKKEDDEGRAVGTNDPIKDEPCTKMTMRLRRNLSSAQFVSVQVLGVNRRAVSVLLQMILNVASKEPG